MNQIQRNRVALAVCLILFAGVIHPGSAGLLLGNHFLTQQQPAVEWQRYKVSGEEFSVLLPVIPAMSTSEVYIDVSQHRRERVLGAYANGVVYAVYTFEKKSLSLDDVIKRFPNRDAQTEPVKVDGVSGIAFKFENDDRMTAVQAFATDHNFYAFQVSGSKLGNPAVGIPQFLSSIRFSKAPQGNDTSDGPGDQSPVAIAETSSTPETIFSGRAVTIKPAVITKPEPRYTEIARQHGITGTVVLRAVFSSSGAVTNIHAVSVLPDGLTEKAILAARGIRFIPSIKDGKFVSMWMELQYNFNLF
jgi:protein TonB